MSWEVDAAVEAHEDAREEAKTKGQPAYFLERRWWCLCGSRLGELDQCTNTSCDVGEDDDEERT